MKFCLTCKGTGRILEQRLSDYANSYDYYPVPCPDCGGGKNSVNKTISLNTSTSFSNSQRFVTRLG